MPHNDRGRETVVLQKVTIPRSDGEFYWRLITNHFTTTANQISLLLDRLHIKKTKTHWPWIAPATWRSYGTFLWMNAMHSILTHGCFTWISKVWSDKWVVSKLQFLIQRYTTSVRAAAKFVRKSSGVKISENEVMIAFDITSLFTSIPKDLAKDNMTFGANKQQTPEQTHGCRHGAQNMSVNLLLIWRGHIWTD